MSGSYVDTKKMSGKAQKQYGQSQINAASDGTIMKAWNRPNKARINLALEGIKNRMEGNRKIKEEVEARKAAADTAYGIKRNK